MNKLIPAILLGAGVLIGIYCAASSRKTVEIEATVNCDPKVKSAMVSLSGEEFEAAGFQLGDSCDIYFEDGYTLKDVPYYTGYYVKSQAPVIVAYPGISYIAVALKDVGFWDAAGLTEGEKVTFRLNEAGKYLATQEALDLVYSFDRADYESDAAFCNFRALSGGRLKENLIYRGTSPVDNSRNRAACTSTLLEENDIGFVFDLADSEESIQTYLTADDFDSGYVLSLYENGRVALLNTGIDFQSDHYRQQIVAGLRQYLQTDGSAYIHCLEGKDRTGFVCALLEALAEATYDEMLSDYMETYKNYYGVTEEGTPEKYLTIVQLYFNDFMAYLHGTDDTELLLQADYSEDAAAYLQQGGMTEEELETLLNRITEPSAS